MRIFVAFLSKDFGMICCFVLNVVQVLLVIGNNVGKVQEKYIHSHALHHRNKRTCLIMSQRELPEH